MIVMETYSLPFNLATVHGGHLLRSSAINEWLQEPTDNEVSPVLSSTGRGLHFFYHVAIPSLNEKKQTIKSPWLPPRFHPEACHALRSSWRKFNDTCSSGLGSESPKKHCLCWASLTSVMPGHMYYKWAGTFLGKMLHAPRPKEKDVSRLHWILKARFSFYPLLYSELH